jgi:hypothetical protein
MTLTLPLGHRVVVSIADADSGEDALCWTAPLTEVRGPGGRGLEV